MLLGSSFCSSKAESGSIALPVTEWNTKSSVSAIHTYLQQHT